MADTSLRVFSIGAIAALGLGMAVAWFALSAGQGAPARIERPPPTAPLTARATLAADGGLRWQDCDGTDRALGSLSDEASAAAGLEALSKELARVTAAPGTRDVCGDSTWTLEVDLDGSVPWSHVSWVLSHAYSLPAKVYRVRFHLLGSLDQGIDQELPRDSCGPTPAPPLSVHALKVVVIPRTSEHDPTARTVVRAAVVDEPYEFQAGEKPPGSVRWTEVEPLRSALRAQFGALKGGSEDLIAAVDLPILTDGVEVPYRDLDAVFLALRDAGFARFEIWGAGRRLPRAR